MDTLIKVAIREMKRRRAPGTESTLGLESIADQQRLLLILFETHLECSWQSDTLTQAIYDARDVASSLKEMYGEAYPLLSSEFCKYEKELSELLQDAPPTQLSFNRALSLYIRNTKQRKGLMQPYRLTWVRAWLLIIASLPFAPGLAANAVFQASRVFIAYIFQMMGWLFFLPSLLVNVPLFFKHLIPFTGEWGWMGEKESQRSMFMRAKMDLSIEGRGSEIVQDIPWLVGGLLAAFMFPGIAVPSAIIRVLLPAFDVLFHGTRFPLELGPLEELKELLIEVAKERGNNPHDLHYIACFSARIERERNRLLLQFANSSFVAIGMFFVLPMLSFGLLVPLLGMAFVFLWTGVFWTLRGMLAEPRRGDDPGQHAGKFELFKSLAKGGLRPDKDIPDMKRHSSLNTRKSKDKSTDTVMAIFDDTHSWPDLTKLGNIAENISTDPNYVITYSEDRSV